ncbi:MAG: hypothetical protein KDN22_15400 [Verrucomicrobiae bacterium]|nr:hypothetical protein [Verrucomicrobiae bacterium]
MKRALMITSAIALTAIGYYRLVRVEEIKDADRTVDAFFAQFRSTDAGSAGIHLNRAAQDNEGIQAILARHSEAISNYPFQEYVPHLDLKLRTAVVEVSWHLNIVLRKGDSGWYISKLDEYTPNDTQAAAD